MKRSVQTAALNRLGSTSRLALFLVGCGSAASNGGAGGSGSLGSGGGGLPNQAAGAPASSAGSGGVAGVPVGNASGVEETSGEFVTGGASASLGGTLNGPAAGGGSTAAGSGGTLADSGGAGGSTASAGAGGTPGTASAYNPCPAAGTDCTIMPLGDSITDGYTVRGGYRIPFFQRAHQEGKHFTFVGSQVNGPATVDNVPFPQHHEGHSAYTIYDAPDAPIPRKGIADYVNDVIPRYHPDIVLLMIGTNDVDGNVDLPNAPKRLGMFMDTIITLDAHALIVVAQITPTMQDPLNQRILTYNAGIPAIVKSRADAGKHVALVDMNGAFTKEPAFKSKYLADRLHPNSVGYQLMSDVWNSVVHDLIH